ncbi:hypothetical protein DPMN_182139 [Dreissena polymorpha]|uniref:Uncharacterized protein n=1 Tax=Dreissena polymorpha TaxID=45954 RepID=A0A9D4DFV1_DREPO|nr:hypothetical protein DPMN_182139 [Dreissena polymorpha]
MDPHIVLSYDTHQISNIFDSSFDSQIVSNIVEGELLGMNNKVFSFKTKHANLKKRDAPRDEIVLKMAREIGADVSIYEIVRSNKQGGLRYSLKSGRVSKGNGRKVLSAK